MLTIEQMNKLLDEQDECLKNMQDTLEEIKAITARLLSMRDFKDDD